MKEKPGMKAITLLVGKEKSALRRHPWIFSGAIDKVLGDPQMGDTVEVYSYSGDFLGLAAYSPSSQIRGRFWTFRDKTPITREYFSAVLDRAIARREWNRPVRWRPTGCGRWPTRFEKHRPPITGPETPQSPDRLPA